jgi:type IV pilus assembly protein PilB
MNKLAKEDNIQGLAKRLVTSGLLNYEQASKIMDEARSEEVAFITLLIQKNILSPMIIATTVSQDFGIPLFDLNALEADMSTIQMISQDLITRHRALPLFKRGKNLFVALSDPTNLLALEEFKFHTNLNTHPIIVEDDKLIHAIEKLVLNVQPDLGDLNDEALESLGVSNSEEEIESTLSDPNDDLVIKYVNKIILDAISKKASDIHFEPYVNQYRIRFRIDGILYEISHPPANLSSRIAARLKVMSKLDISERRVPQDGHFKMMLSKQRGIEFRINTCPTIAGEKIVLRLIDPSSTQLEIEQLGYASVQKDKFLKAIHRPQGMVLVTGPTGSGKTVSLYTALNILNTTERNISTVEDPVELNITGINQVAVNIKAGLNFSVALRAFLRQDPDVIMVGEIRDLETAEIAVKAAQTGHMVLSTLHTNSAAETLTRLMNMGIPTYNIATSVNLIVAQRLARRLCKMCKLQTNYPLETLLQMGFQEDSLKDATFYEPIGCAHCTNGYAGRVGIYEVLEISDEIGRAIMSGKNSLDILDIARSEGMEILRESGLNKAKEGLTSLVEINRVTKD